MVFCLNYYFLCFIQIDFLNIKNENDVAFDRTDKGYLSTFMA